MTIAVTYTFSNGTTSSATEVNTNFQDIIDGVTDGTEPISVGQLTVAGAVALNGNTTIGNASSDDITINASLASNIVIKTANTYGIGAAGTGLTGIYFQSSASNTTRLIFASGVANITWTLPGTAGTAGHGIVSNGSGTFSFVPLQTDINTVSSADYTVLTTDGYSTIIMTTGGTDRTITLPAAASSTDRVLTIIKLGDVDSDGTGKLIVDGNASETIGGSATVELYTEGDKMTIICDGSNWQIKNLLQTEYVYNTTTTDAADTTAFGYNNSGVQFGNFTASRAKRVRFLSAIRGSDTIELETTQDSAVSWQRLGLSDLVQAHAQQNTTFYGIKIDPVSSTDLDIVFRTYRLASGATFSAAGTDWSAIDADSQFKWRVVKRRFN